LFGFFASYEDVAEDMIDAKLALPAYELVLKAAHTFNLLDARGAIFVSERATYIGRIRAKPWSFHCSVLVKTVGVPEAERQQCGNTTESVASTTLNFPAW